MNARAASCALSYAGCSRKRAVSEMAIDSYGERPEASWASTRCTHGLVLRWQGRRATGALRHNPVRDSNSRFQTSVLIGRRSAAVKQQRKLVPRPGEAAHHRPDRNAECFGGLLVGLSLDRNQSEHRPFIDMQALHWPGLSSPCTTVVALSCNPEIGWYCHHVAPGSGLLHIRSRTAAFSWGYLISANRCLSPSTSTRAPVAGTARLRHVIIRSTRVYAATLKSLPASLA